ncbi:MULTISPECIES: transporter [Flavobacteriaceae]|uniref:transporter n=1 Tax=Flavobacteriaceae TaxID=49546 RepID=UPI0014910022|nr:MULTISPECIES: transporter [Allomuricauda]MDC6364533.1 transporter [Muricauda sp. AC10]
MDNSSLKKALFLFFAVPSAIMAQYTDVINSNRPGRAVSAYAVGKNVAQVEAGLFYERQNNDALNFDSNIIGTDIALRYGLFFEQLEIVYEGSFVTQSLTFSDLTPDETRTDFTRNRIGAKYLIFDPFKDPEKNKPNLYSWRANNVFQWKNLIPAVSLYGGATFTLGDNPFYPGDPNLSYRGAVATQSRLSPRFVLISNIAYDRIGTDFPEWSYAISVTHAFRNPKWSVFLENQGIKSDRYSDLLVRAGLAYLFSENFQADFHLGSNFKNSPSRMFGVAGLSYRFDFHKDVLIPIDEQSPAQNGPKIKKSDVKKKRKKSKKNKKKKDLDF